MDTPDLPDTSAAPAENADGQVYAVQLRLEEAHDWSALHAEEFCFDFKSNYKRIVHMCSVLGFSADRVAELVDREARDAGYVTR